MVATHRWPEEAQAPTHSPHAQGSHLTRVLSPDDGDTLSGKVSYSGPSAPSSGSCMTGLCCQGRRIGAGTAGVRSAGDHGAFEHPAEPAAPPPSRDWLQGGPADPAPANGEAAGGAELGCGAPRGFPGARARVLGAGRSSRAGPPGTPGAPPRASCSPGCPRVVREDGNPHPREAS